MGSGLFANPVKDYTGSVPGAMADLYANIPAAGYVVGDWFLAIDTKKMYRWDGAAWVEVLSDGGGGGGGDWQSVMAVGNTTTTDILKNNGGGQNISKTFELAGGGHTQSTSPNAVFGSVGAGIVSFAEFSAGKWSVGYAAWDFIDLWAEITFVFFKKNTRRQFILYPDKSGDVAVGGNKNFTTTGSAGATVVTIPHSLVSFGGLNLTPTWASITAKNAATATLLVGGYYLTYDATNIYVNLLVATVGTPAINIDWNAIT